MARIRVERTLTFGTPYTPEMEAGRKRPAPSWREIPRQVREAGELGYDTVMAVETQHDPFLALAIAAQEPSELELATGIALAYTKSPVATAYIAWDLQAMSG
ncbi:MAG: LLM class flavin-dependent oxidoreductase, partial [Candidatus Binataceae bacterium]